MKGYDAKYPLTGSGAITDDNGNRYDYWNLTISYGPVSKSTVRDKFGTYYDGVGVNVGKAATGISVSFMFGQVEGGFDDQNAAQRFCSGPSVSTTVGGVLGITRTESSNHRFANEAGFLTPQIGKSFMFYEVRLSEFSK